MPRLRMVTYTIDVEGSDVVVSGQGGILRAEGMEASFVMEPYAAEEGVHLSVYSDITVGDDPVEVATTFFLDNETLEVIKEFLDGPKLA